MEVWRINNANLYCSIDTLATSDIGNRIFNAARIIEHFNIPLKNGFSLSQFSDEWLVANSIPSKAQRSSVSILTAGEESAAEAMLPARRAAEVARLPSVELPYWISFCLVNPPDKLYRVIFNGGKASSKPGPGLISWSEARPRNMDDREFKKCIKLHADRDTSDSDRRYHIMFSVFSSRETAIQTARANEHIEAGSVFGLAHIETARWADHSGSRLIYHAGYIIKGLRIPLANPQHAALFNHEYFIAN